MRKFFKSSTVVQKVITATHLIKAFGLGHKQMDLVRHYISGRLLREQPDEKHLAEALSWLSRAQDVCNGNGVSAVFDLKTGWGSAYPETSGYIIATYLAYSEITGNKEYLHLAQRIGDWEISIQTPSGGVLSSPNDRTIRVFNTGQVILGWCALYEKTHDEKYLHAAVRAGQYLVIIQEEDGSWRKDTYCGPRTYHARVAWALLRLASLSGELRFAKNAYKNLAWVVNQQKANGWFKMCGFDNDLPIMHVIIYTLRGLLESYLAGVSPADNPHILQAVIRGADAVCSAVENHPVRGIPWMAPASFDENWESTDRHSCLTGNAQLACFLFLLAHATNKGYYRSVAENVLQTLKKTQLVESTFPEIRGAIAGSYPVYQGYHRNSYPNWATKFFADALMMKMFFAQRKRISA